MGSYLETSIVGKLILVLLWYLLKVVIFTMPAPRTNINRLQFVFDQLLNVVNLNSERDAIVVQEGGESAQIFISDFNINRLEKLAWLGPEINLRNDIQILKMKFLLVESRNSGIWKRNRGLLESGI